MRRTNDGMIRSGGMKAMSDYGQGSGLRVRRKLRKERGGQSAPQESVVYLTADSNDELSEPAEGSGAWHGTDKPKGSPVKYIISL